jgi:hemin uptake protein HemP
MNDAHTPKESDATVDDNATAPERDAERVIRSEELFAGERIVLIQHAGERYRLLITRNDRLILQK